MKLGKSIPPRTEKLISQSASGNPTKKPRRELERNSDLLRLVFLIKKDQELAIMSLGKSTSIRRLKVICLIETLTNLSFTKI